MIREGVVSLEGFLLGVGELSYYVVLCGWPAPLGEVAPWLAARPWLYCIIFYLAVNIFIALAFRGPEWQIAVRGCLLGAVCGGGVMVGAMCPPSYQVFGWYLVVLSVFHYSEYLTTALGNPRTLSLDSYLINHSWAYTIAAVTSWAEFFLERWLVVGMKEMWVGSLVGVGMCLVGEILRKSAMLTAKTNFNHMVQVERHQDHQLVTWGIYQLCRHPSYVGWFWWSIGTQVVLLNPLCTLAYTLASWTFFNDRIHFEEMTLIHFFGEKYLDYQKKVGTGLPFITGYVPPKVSAVRH